MLKQCREKFTHLIKGVFTMDILSYFNLTISIVCTELKTKFNQISFYVSQLISEVLKRLVQCIVTHFFVTQEISRTFVHTVYTIYCNDLTEDESRYNFRI